MSVDVKYQGEDLGSVHGLIYVDKKLRDTGDKICFRVKDLNALEVILRFDYKVLQVDGKDMSFIDFKEKYLQYIPDVHFDSVGVRPPCSLLAGAKAAFYFKAR